MIGLLDRLVDASNDELLGIYLNDHRAGSAGGEALARRVAAANRDNQLGRYLNDAFIPELMEEKAALDEVMANHGTGTNPVKVLAARGAELVGRAKLNGRLQSYSPLSRLLEIEGLIAAVTAKRQLWSVVGHCEALPVARIAYLSGQADKQRRDLSEHHQWAVAEMVTTA